MTKVLISSSTFAEFDKKPKDILISAGMQIINNPHGRRLKTEEIVSLGVECEGVIAGLECFNKEVLKQLHRVKVISRIGIGTDNIDLTYAKQSNIIVCNTPDGPTDAVAELAVALVIDLLRKISLMNEHIKSGQWQRFAGFLLKGKTVGIIGLGRIGKKVAKLLQSFGTSIIANDVIKDDLYLKTNNIEFLELENVLKKSDIIMLHLSGSNCLIGKRELSIIKKGAYLLNLSRGGVVDEEQLKSALTDGRIAGAALDVFKKEPYGGPLAALDNVILTPHIGSYTRESRSAMEAEAATNLINVLLKKVSDG